MTGAKDADQRTDFGGQDLGALGDDYHGYDGHPHLIYQVHGGLAEQEVQLCHYLVGEGWVSRELDIELDLELKSKWHTT